MFQKARLKLTFWYIAIILVISGLFSVAFYNASTRELNRIVTRLQLDQERWTQQGNAFTPPFPLPPPPIAELETSARNLLVNLFVINGVILVFSGAAAYFLAGRTMQPIKAMLDEQNQFISNSSHELRTPLSTLRAQMEGHLLEKRISDSDARQLIKSNLEEVSRLQALANNLLRLTKLHDIASQPYRDTVPLGAVIKTAIKQTEALAAKKQITVESVAKECSIIGDRDALTELFVILLDNAVKYSPPATQVMVQTNHTDGNVEISVKDQGIGISEEDLPYIFDRFYRSDKSRSQTDGFGLGLSIAGQIAKKHGGIIRAVSELSKGSTFTVRLPLA